MLNIFLISISFFVLASPAWASSPGMIEGPAGCSWLARVDSISAAPPLTLNLTLIQDAGRCMEFVTADQCGEKGRHLTITPSSGASADYAKNLKEGEQVQVWIDESGAHFEHPVCTKTPIKE